MGELAYDSWLLYLRLVRITWRMPIFMLISIIQPLLWVILFGQLFGSVTTIPGFGAENYIQFLAPGIAIMTALFGAAYSGMGSLQDIDKGVLDRLLTTPVRRPAVIAARVLLSATQVLVQAAIILAAAVALGARPRGGVFGMVVLFVAASFLAAGFAAFSNAMGLVTRRQEVVVAVTNFVVLPMTFLSSMIITPGLMPEWIRSASRFNPVHWAVIAARGGFEGEITGEVFRCLGLLAAFVVVCSFLAIRAFRIYQRTI
jgi:ABC-2 type transport system permease protein